MLARVREFGENHRDLFPESSHAGQTIGQVAAAVEQLRGHAVSKMVTAKEGKNIRAFARRALIDQLVKMHRTARVIGETTPGLDDKFRLPRPRTDPGLITAARVFARDAVPLEDRFIARAMSTTFLTDLETLVAQFEDAIRQCDVSREENTAARAHIKAALQSGFAAVRELEAMLANHLHDDPVTLEVWERERRVDYPRRGKNVAVAAGSGTCASRYHAGGCGGDVGGGQMTRHSYGNEGTTTDREH
jgi:hypothetical protein